MKPCSDHNAFKDWDVPEVIAMLKAGIVFCRCDICGWLTTNYVKEDE